MTNQQYQNESRNNLWISNEEVRMSKLDAMSLAKHLKRLVSLSYKARNLESQFTSAFKEMLFRGSDLLRQKTHWNHSIHSFKGMKKMIDNV